MLRTAFATMLVLLGALPAAAQAPLTLDEAIALALERNPVVRSSAAGEDASAARLRQARAGYLPRVDFVEGWQRGDNPVYVFSSLLSQRRFTAADFALDALNHPDPLSNFRAAIMIEQPVFDGLRTHNAMKAAALDSELSRLDSRAAAAELRLAVVTAFGNTLAAGAARAYAAAAVAAAEADVRRATDRRDAGLETEASVLAFQVQLSNAQSRLVKASADETVARAALNAAMGAPLDDARALAPLAPRAAVAIDAAALETEALAARPEIVQAGLRTDRAAAGAATARAGFLPQVFVQGAAEANGGSFGDRESSWIAALQVRWNVFAGGADRARMDEAAAGIRRAEAERERLRDAVRLEVRTAVARYQSAIAHEATTRHMVGQARESQRIIRDRYEAGLAPAIEVLRAAELLAESEAASVAAANDVHITAAALDRAVGRQGSR
jgi:outer membrane protein